MLINEGIESGGISPSGSNEEIIGRNLSLVFRTIGTPTHITADQFSDVSEEALKAQTSTPL
jgi:hypothetical protein